MTREQIDIYNELDNFVEENMGEVSHTEIAKHFYEVGRNNAIEEACEWLKANLCEHYADEPIAHKMGRPISGYISFFEEPPVGVIMDFRKAMKGGNQ